MFLSSVKGFTYRGQLAHAPHAVHILRRLEGVLDGAQVLLPARHAVPVHLGRQECMLDAMHFGRHWMIISQLLLPISSASLPGVTVCLAQVPGHAVASVGREICWVPTAFLPCSSITNSQSRGVQLPACGGTRAAWSTTVRQEASHAAAVPQTRHAAPRRLETGPVGSHHNAALREAG